MTAITPLTLLIADDHKAMRIGLGTVFEDFENIDVVGLVGDVDSVVAAYVEKRPDVVLLDYRMPGGNADTATTRILKIDPDAKVIVLTAYEGEEDVWRMVQAGAKGYLTKASSSETIYNAVLTVADGKTYFKEEIAKKIEMRNQRPDLSKRERQVLELLSLGMSNRMIMEHLKIAEPTVKHHVSSILAKFGAEDRTHAVVKAIRRGIIHLDI